MNVTVPRQELILKKVEEVGNIAITELAAELQVSEQTIRRDIRKLEEMDLLSRYHGGVTRPQHRQIVNRELSEREQSFVKEKEAIAQAVAGLIPDDATVFITIGTTVEKIAQALASKKHLRVITDSLRVAAILYRNPNIEVMIPPGTLRAGNGGIEGPNTIMSLSEFRADYTITSVGAIDSDGTLLDFNLTEVTAAKSMMTNTKNVVIACDHTKFDSVASVRLGHLRQCDYLITDEKPKDEIMQVLEGTKTRLIIADGSEKE